MTVYGHPAKSTAMPFFISSDSSFFPRNFVLYFYGEASNSYGSPYTTTRGLYRHFENGVVAMFPYTMSVYIT